MQTIAVKFLLAKLTTYCMYPYSHTDDKPANTINLLQHSIGLYFSNCNLTHHCIAISALEQAVKGVSVFRRKCSEICWSLECMDRIHVRLLLPFLRWFRDHIYLLGSSCALQNDGWDEGEVKFPAAPLSGIGQGNNRSSPAGQKRRSNGAHTRPAKKQPSAEKVLVRFSIRTVERRLNRTYGHITCYNYQICVCFSSSGSSQLVYLSHLKEWSTFQS